MPKEILIIRHRQIEALQVVINKINRNQKSANRDKITVPLPKEAHPLEKTVQNNNLPIIQLMQFYKKII